MKCNNKYCIYNKNQICIKKIVSINETGICNDIKYVAPEELTNFEQLKAEKLNILTKTNYLQTLHNQPIYINNLDTSHLFKYDLDNK